MEELEGGGDVRMFVNKGSRIVDFAVDDNVAVRTGQWLGADVVVGIIGGLVSSYRSCFVRCDKNFKLV